jgi:hypothetical protein
MNHEPDIARLALLTPETLAELEELVRQRLCGRLRDFRLSIRDAGLVLGGRARSHHAKQLAQHALMNITSAPIKANEIAVFQSLYPVPCTANVAVEAMPVAQMPRATPAADFTW